MEYLIFISFFGIVSFVSLKWGEYRQRNRQKAIGAFMADANRRCFTFTQDISRN